MQVRELRILSTARASASNALIGTVSPFLSVHIDRTRRADKRDRTKTDDGSDMKLERVGLFAK